MFTAHYLFLGETIRGEIDGLPVSIPINNKPYRYGTGLLLIGIESAFYPQAIRLFPRRGFTASDGTYNEFTDDKNTYLTDDIQALEWFGRLMNAYSEAERAYPDVTGNNYLKFCQMVADRMGVPYVGTETIVAPRKLAPGAMTPEQVRLKEEIAA